jgi:hypothetical protein
MKKSIGARFGVASPLSAKTTQLKTYGCIAIVCLAGCTTTQVRWDAIGMRQQVMKYYNDEIVENLIRAREKLPFVHLDITGLTTIATSQLSGTIGAGETQASTKTSRSMIGALSTLSRAVTYPFAYSVSPQRGNSLQISAAPVLGPLAADGATSSKKTIKTEETAPTQVNGKQTTTKTTRKASLFRVHGTKLSSLVHTAMLLRLNLLLPELERLRRSFSATKANTPKPSVFLA